MKKTNKPDINRLLELQHLLLAFSQIDRVIHRKHGSVYINETDSEHSYNLAITAWFIANYFPELNRDLVIRLALVHDLVEVHAGDTYAFAEPEMLASKHDRETAALAQLTQEWPDFPDLATTIESYENRDSPEAKFVYALDKIMPIMQIYINEGHTWQQEDLTLERLHEEKMNKVVLSPEIAPYYEKLRELLLQSPHLIKPE